MKLIPGDAYDIVLADLQSQLVVLDQTIATVEALRPVRVVRVDVSRSPTLSAMVAAANPEAAE